MEDPRQTPFNRHGQLSPPSSAKGTFDEPVTGRYGPQPGYNSPRSSIRSSQLDEDNSRMAIYHSGQQFSSPDPILANSPYPTPISQSQSESIGSTQYIDRASEEQQEFAEFQKWKLQQKLRQQQIQVRQEHGPPAAMPRNPQYVQRPFPLPGQGFQDSGYGSGNYEDAGQFYGQPGQKPQAYSRPGHRYGNIIASGNSRVVRGNVIDSTRPNMVDRQHDYGIGQTSDKARIVDGNITAEMMKGFWD